MQGVKQKERKKPIKDKQQQQIRPGNKKEGHIPGDGTGRWIRTTDT